MYELLLLVGGIGFLAMALLGMVHGGGGHQGHAAGHGHGALGHTHAPALGHGHGGHAAHPVKGFHLPRGFKGGSDAKDRATGLLTLLSPMDLFAMAAGAGMAGTLLKGVLSPAMLIWAAIAGALAFNFLITKPIFALAMKFVTNPSEGIEGQVRVKATAITKFDGEGKGLVQMTMDGQLIQLLARLDTAEVELGEGVYKGDEVIVTEVDVKRNACTVSKLQA